MCVVGLVLLVACMVIQFPKVPEMASTPPAWLWAFGSVALALGGIIAASGAVRRKRD
jgi:hypothetical protein